MSSPDQHGTTPASMASSGATFTLTQRIQAVMATYHVVIDPQRAATGSLRVEVTSS